jgi:hypothetical protein
MPGGGGLALQSHHLAQFGQARLERGQVQFRKNGVARLGVGQLERQQLGRGHTPAHTPEC